MSRSELRRLLPNASPALIAILDGARGTLEPPIRSEIFGLQRFAQHGHSLAETHRVGDVKSAIFFPRLRDNIRTLKEAHAYIGTQALTGYDISPAAEWLLDNFHLIEAQLRQIREGLPRSYFRSLPVLIDEPLAGLPRVYGVAWAFVAHTDGAFDDDLLVQFLSAYQETRALNLSEIWALPTTLRVVLIENLRRLAERVATNKAAREAANVCCDALESYSIDALDELLALLNTRGVGRVFLGQVAERLRAQKTADEEDTLSAYRDWLLKVFPDASVALGEQSIGQAADNLSVSNAVTSLRAIGDADWPDVVARSSALMRLLLATPNFSAEETGTQDHALHGIERLARRYRLSELTVTQAVVKLMQSAPSIDAVESVAGYWLLGAGRPTLLHALGFRGGTAFGVLRSLRPYSLFAYLATLAAGTSALMIWVVRHHDIDWTPSSGSAWLMLLAVLLMIFPASEAVVAIINRLISESVKPRHLSRLSFVEGVPAAHRVMVVIPSMLTGASSIAALAHQLLLHYLANPETNAQFALLSDWADADAEHTVRDSELLDAALMSINDLNTHYPHPDAGVSRFLLLHRHRRFSPTEQRWIGWERKRGKLEMLVEAIADGTDGTAGTGGAHGDFIDLGPVSTIVAATRYIVTLDSDTQLPPGRLRELVGVAAHPMNLPKLDATGTRVISGYGILQPRVVTPLPEPKTATAYHWLFAGQCGIDPYSAASSEVYQDVFGEGTFTGKGLLNVAALRAVLVGRLPEGQVLSHDLLEGAIARCAAVTDVTVIEDAPTHADVAASRVHRWTRGDWQLLPLLLRSMLPTFMSSTGLPLRAINRWKMFDNLRRSLVAPASLALLLLALATDVVSPWAALTLVLAASLAGPVLGAFAGLAPSRDDVALRHFYWQATRDVARAVWAGLWHLALLLFQAIMSVDAIARSLYRMLISHQHLLQWTTAAAAQAAAKLGIRALARSHWSLPIASVVVLVALLLVGTPHPKLALVLAALWAATPVWIALVSRPFASDQGVGLSNEERAYLDGIARDTWRFFERCVVADDNHLPPDNLQVLPHDMVAHRTSPTNIGLYLLSTACARQFGWIGTREVITRMEATLATLNRLQRYRGHFLNWYDTQSCAPLLPAYVSTVDSGNLSGHLLAVAQACAALARDPFDTAAARRYASASSARLAAMLARSPSLTLDSALSGLILRPDPLTEYQNDPVKFSQSIRDAEQALTLLRGDDCPADPLAKVNPRKELVWCLSDHITSLRSAMRDLEASTASDAADAASKLCHLAVEFEQLAWQADYSFLYHRKRHLLHIGFRVADQQLDTSFYDLLASESRLTSLLAVAKGDVPTRHWSSLGRPFYAVGKMAGLRSWSGSMFEYLMPSLILAEPVGSVLRDACNAALLEQIRYTATQGVPWGISESAYAGRDETLAYQYAPEGVPRLALRRTPPDELVIAPYATALAAQIAPRLAALNYAALEKLCVRARYGFIEALDYSPARQAEHSVFTPVATFMAHHQGMTIVALANVLLDARAQQWGMANAHIESVASMLHESAPREVSVLNSPSAGLPTHMRLVRDPGLLREVKPGTVVIEPTHVLSNGRYTVTLRANGAGSSRWGQTGISRTRDDALRDRYGSFFYLRWPVKTGSDAALGAHMKLASITQHPAGDAAAEYSCTYQADRVCFTAAWIDIQAQITVWVSPEDDIEFRQIELKSRTDRTLEIDLISAFEVTLTELRADESHPAFTNLFVRAQWLASHQAILFERTARLETERGLHAAHFIAESDASLVAVRTQTDRQRWMGRNGCASDPLAAFENPPEAAHGDALQPLETGLDPVCAMSARLRVPPRARVCVTFATAASNDEGVLRSVIDKYRQASHIKRASMMSATLTGIRLRSLRISAENHSAIQTLTTALSHSVTSQPATTVGVRESVTINGVCDRRLLWRFGISGDRPIVLLFAGGTNSLGMLTTLSKALRQWSRGGVACDLVVLNAEPVSYQMTVQREIVASRERYMIESAGDARDDTALVAGFHILRTDEISHDELSTLQILARISLVADGRPFVHHVNEWVEGHERAFARRRATATVTVATHAPANIVPPAPGGTFDEVSNEFRFDVNSGLRPLRPWTNVLANPEFGCQITEAGGGYTWAVNSRLNQLTAWSNDPVLDVQSEWFLLQDLKTTQVWNISASAQGGDAANYRVAHGQGYSVVRHNQDALEVTATWCVDTKTSIKQVRVRVVNRGHSTRALRLIGIMEWLMGGTRTDRNTVLTAARSQPAGGQNVTALLCTQRERSGGFGDGTAFLTLGRTDAKLVEGEEWSCDRREFFDELGQLTIPARLGRRSGVGLDPCAALATQFQLNAGEVIELVFLLGYAANANAALALVEAAHAQTALSRIEQARNYWDALLDTSKVKTPDPLFDAMVNRWLLYQVVSCRMWAKSGFYQAGGATGFRDQLQDSMALSWAAPDMLRAQIVLCASRQFAQGDVQHWWHSPGGAGVRTHFSDDLLWLAFACTHYLQATGKADVLDVLVPFIEGAAVPDGAEDAYYTPTISEQTATVYEHAARAIDKSLRVGVHGLPLMGSGDWNDGMNRVGHGGRGESVWLGWFLCKLVDDFAPVARARGEVERAAAWQSGVAGWSAALLSAGWDGAWFKRAFFDDGEALGSHDREEARIDMIAQAWAVLSGVAPRDMQRAALASVEALLVDHDGALLRLLDPPLANATPSAGYIQAYPPGVRENAGQYSHGAVWALMAQADFATSSAGSIESRDLPYRYFTYLSPAHRAIHPKYGATYGIEPYVMAGDVYTHPPYVGRGGWSWYTGSAAWMHRAAIESIFGLRQTAAALSFNPCMPSHWPQAELTLKRDGRSMHFVFTTATGEAASALAAKYGAKQLAINEALEWATLPTESSYVISVGAALA